MRTIVSGIVAFALVSCSQSPSGSNSNSFAASDLISRVKGQAEAKIQAKLNADFGDRKAVVATVEVVKTGDAKFDGVAHVRAAEKTVDLPFTAVSDGATTIVTISDAEIGKQFAKNAEETVASLGGKYSDYVLTPSVFRLLPLAAQKNRALIAGRLQVVVPIEERDGGYFGTGCKAHFCTSDTAGWWISKDGKRSVVVVAQWWEPTAYGKSQGIEGSVNWHIYGADIDTLPPSLSQWARGIGLSEGNVVGPDIQYTPPGKD